MAAKRPAGEEGPVPPAKRPTIPLTPLHVPPATSQEDLDIKILQVQNRKLAERLKERNHHQELLQQRVDRLEEDKEAAVEVIVAVEQHLKVFVQELQAHLGLNTETLSSSLTNLSNQSANAAINSLDQFFSSISSCVVSRGLQLFTHLEELKDTITKSGGVESSIITELEKLVKERQQSLEALDDMRQRLDPSEVHKVKGHVEVLEAKCERLENDLGDARFDLEKSLTRNERLQRQLVEALENTRSASSPSESVGESSVRDSIPMETSTQVVSPTAPLATSTTGVGTGEKATTVSNEELDSLKSEIEDAQKLAESRLAEVDQLSQQIINLKQDLEKAKLANQQIPESSVRESAVYKSLQSQYSILMLEHQQLRTCYEEARRLLNTAKTQHIMQLEDIRQEELCYQSEVREEMSQLETSLATVQRDYELLKIEHEQAMAANEQAAPIAKELQEMVDSLQKNIQQLKGEISRYKTRAHKAEEKIGKLQEEKEKDTKGEQEVPASSQEDKTSTSSQVQESSLQDQTTPMFDKTEQDTKERIQTLEMEKKELELQLESYLTADKEQREKAELITAEKKARQHTDELKKKLEESRKEYEKKKEHLKEDHKQLQREVSNKKQEAQALMAEMESIAQAFEEMQEQNIRLLQQLKEKDDANFKLMSERIKSKSLQKLLTEEKQLLQAEVAAITAERDRLNTLVQKLEDREKNSEAAIASSEKELSLKQQAMEIHKKKALESSQQLQDVLLKVSELEGLVASIQQSLMSKTEECEQESQNTRRAQEEVSNMKRKLEKYRQREWATMSDEVLLEEIKTYRTKLNCPVCTSRKKDTVLTKCFHVFCSECIKTRYETRQRKCPKCNAAFGANDFHKIYLS